MSAASDQIERSRMVFHIKPIAHVRAVTVDRQRLAFERVEHHKRDQFFGKMKRTVVVGAVRNDYGQAIGAKPGTRQMVSRRLGRRVGRGGVVGRCLAESTVGTKRAVDLVRRYMQKAKISGLRLR